MRTRRVLKLLAVVAALGLIAAIAVAGTLATDAHHAQEDKWWGRERGSAFGKTHTMTQSLAQAVTEAASCRAQLDEARCMMRAKWFVWSAVRSAKVLENDAACRPLAERAPTEREQAALLCRTAAPAGGWNGDAARRCKKLVGWLVTFCRNAATSPR